ncbi:MAG: DUF4251 domain-containing protein [Bacteroidetes bacterium]|nr:DUF4251 domain-containing protein [Bacteroidota bacterium]MBS1631660.1 DUF4251 domain-containing protein [Bacteroidota bacterium]
MKTAAAIKGISLFIVLTCAGIPLLFSQSKTEIKKMAESGRYVFVAQSVLTGSGKNIFLSSGYDLTVTPDSLIAYLPYYGISYRAPADPTKAGVKFTSTKFDYNLQKAKRDGWDISINTRDQSDDYMLILNISSNGNASLQVLSTFRQAISYSGYIKDYPESKKAF